MIVKLRYKATTHISSTKDLTVLRYNIVFIIPPSLPKLQAKSSFPLPVVKLITTMNECLCSHTQRHEQSFAKLHFKKVAF